MAEKDLTEKILEDYPDVFADIYNALVFNGKQVIKDSELSESMVHSQYKADDRKVHEMERDTVKRWGRDNVVLAILGVENQSKPEKLMASRVIGYDGASYCAQTLRIDAEKRELKKLHKEKKISDAAYIEAGGCRWADCACCDDCPVFWDGAALDGAKIFERASGHTGRLRAVCE